MGIIVNGRKIDDTPEEVLERLDGNLPAPECPHCGEQMENVLIVKTAGSWNTRTAKFSANFDPGDTGDIVCPNCHKLVEVEIVQTVINWSKSK